MTQTAQMTRWNVFAAVLEDVLQAHGHRLGQLDDRAGIHPEVVRRLQVSLHLPRFYVLSPDDLDTVLNTFCLTMAEKVKLRAAVLATAVEAKLMDRIDAATALDIAWAILPLLEQALRKQLEDGGSIRLDDEDSSAEFTPFDRRFETELEFMERGLLAMHLADAAQSRIEEEAQIREAHGWFLLARDGFDIAAPSHRDDTWQYWREKAQSALEQTSARMRDFA
ncbi:MAG TPA: hypothetical protein VGP82_16925 [Ktedonobacterales bacterium]|nr:hypothetical protein [Ktedonobacterales bacterium]